MEVRACRFAGFEDRDILWDLDGGQAPEPCTRTAGALSQVSYDSDCAADPRDSVEALTFSPGTGPPWKVQRTVWFRAGAANMPRNTVFVDRNNNPRVLMHRLLCAALLTSWITPGVPALPPQMEAGSWDTVRQYTDRSPEPILLLGNGTVDSGMDLDLDGLPDLLVGTPLWVSNSGGGVGQGTIRCLSGADSSLLLAVNGQSQDGLGSDICFVPDVDGDGVPEILAGGSAQGFPKPGSAWLFSGATGQAVTTWTGIHDADLYGWAVGVVSDLSNDGIPDYLVGAPWADANGVFLSGLVQVIDGASGAILYEVTGTISAGYGNDVLGLPDVNGDGLSEFLVDGNGTDVWLFSGADGTLLQSIPSPFGFRGVAFGSPLADVGDLDGDGLPEIAIGDTDGDGLAEFLVGVPGDEDPAGARSGAIRLLELDPWLRPARQSFSASQGGALHFDLDFPDSEAGAVFRLLASDVLDASFRYHGLELPLGDSKLLRLSGATPPPRPEMEGTLDLFGDAVVDLPLAPGELAPLAGRNLGFTAITLVPGLETRLASWPGYVHVRP